MVKLPSLTQEEGVDHPPFMKEHPLHWGETRLLTPHPHLPLPSLPYLPLQLYLSVHRCGTVRLSKQPGQKAGRLGPALALSWSRIHPNFSSSSLFFLSICHDHFFSFHKGSRRASHSHGASVIRSPPTASISESSCAHLGFHL